MTVPHLPVLVAGAGPSGLVAALTLAQNGIKVRLIEKVEKPHVGSRGFGIQPRTCELFQMLGILEDFQKVATPIPTMLKYKLPDGATPVEKGDIYSKKDASPDRPFQNGVCLSQDLLEEILTKNHLNKYGVSIEYGKALVGMHQTTDGITATVATYKDGNQTDEQESVTAQYFLGTDGARGASRKLLGMTFQGETRDADGMVWGDVEIDGLNTDYWHVWAQPLNPVYTIMARPVIPEGKKFGVGIIGKDFDPRDLADEEKAKEFIIRETGRTDLKFGKFTWLSYFKPNMRMVNKFQEGRAFLAGDAAHVHSPSGGQGLNCSIQDATNISWKLALVLKGLAPPALLETYNTERLPVIANMLQTTSSLYTHMVPKSEAPTGPTPSTVPPTEDNDDKKSGFYRWRNDALEMYGINYRFSDIVLDEREAQSVDRRGLVARAYDGYPGVETLQAGDRAPQAPGLIDKDGKETTFFDLFKLNMHTVLIFFPGGTELNPEATKKWSSSTVQTFAIAEAARTIDTRLGNALVDREGHAAKAYRVERDELTIVVVRPDGFVGAIVKDVEGLDRYFGKIFTA